MASGISSSSTSSSSMSAASSRVLSGLLWEALKSIALVLLLKKMPYDLQNHVQKHPRFEASGLEGVSLHLRSFRL